MAGLQTQVWPRLAIYVGVGDLNSGLHAEQQALLIPEPSSQPLVAGFEIYRCEVSDFVLWFQNCLGYSPSWKSSLYFPTVVW